MAETAELTGFLDELLTPAEFEDLGPNGLQVPGATAVERVVTGVTAQRALFERAVEQQAQLVLVHHGLFWRFNPIGLTPLLAERLRPLFKHDIALAAYHLVMADAREAGIHFIAAGHYATETFGVRRLGELLAERFGIDHIWVDLPNPV